MVQHYGRIIACMLVVATMTTFMSAANGIPGASSPVRFTENRGQVVDSDGRVRNDIRFTADCGGARLYFTDRGVSYVFSATDPAAMSTGQTPDGFAKAVENGMAAVAPRGALRLHRVDMELAGAAALPRIRFEDALPGYTNYYLAHCPEGVTHVKSYATVVYEDVYDNIDLLFRTAGGRIKYEYRVRPGGDPAAIRMQYRGMDEMRLLPGGALELASPIGRMEEAAPYTFEDGGRAIRSAYRLRGNELGFEVGAFDRTRTLVIDPWSTFYGGNGADMVSGLKTDANGNVYVSGYTTSTVFPTTAGAFQSSFAGVSDAFIALFDGSGVLQWSTYYGGSSWESDFAFPKIALDASGNIYVAGMTSSTDFPVSSGALQAANGGGFDGFLVKFSTAGTRLWATYLGGSDYDGICGLSAEGITGVFVTGFAYSRNFPTTSGAYQPSRSNGNQADAILARLDANGALLWSTYFGGKDHEKGHAVTVDGGGNAVVCGATVSTDFPVTNGAWQAARAGGLDAFLIKFTPSGVLTWSTYFGGSMFDSADDLAISQGGDITITGRTYSTDLPVTQSAMQPAFGGGAFDCMITRFNANGQMLWSTFYGGSKGDWGKSVAADAGGGVLVGGWTYSPNLPVSSGAMQPSFGGVDDGFSVKLSSAGAMLWGTYIGGSQSESILAVTIDGNGNAILGGYTGSVNFPVLNAWQSSLVGTDDAIIMHLDPNGQLPRPYQPPVAVASAQPTSGDAPLVVQFTGANASDPGGSNTTFAWDFGDGGSATTANPSHTYLNPGNYTATLTVTDNLSATATASVTITVTAPSTATVRVVSQTVTRVLVQSKTNRWEGRDLVVVRDQNGDPVSGAVVTANYSGPNSGTASGTTGANGEVTLATLAVKNPSTTTPWEFTVTGVQATGYTFDASGSVLTAQEVLPKSAAHAPETPELSIHPNPLTRDGVVRLVLPRESTIRLQVFDALGRRVATVAEGRYDAGTHSIPFDASGLPRGSYFVRLSAGMQAAILPLVIQ